MSTDARPEDGSTKNGDQPVTISAPPAATVTVDPQNPLPEASFFWRRVLTMIVSFVLLGIAWHNAVQLHDLGVSGDLLTFAKWCIGLNGFVLMCYFIGPSAAELTAMIQSARIIKSSIKVAGEAQENKDSAEIRPESGAGARFRKPAARDGHFSEPPLREPEIEDEEEDAAPTERKP